MDYKSSVRVDEVASEADGVALWPVYQAVFGDHSDFDAWRDGVWDRHRAREGFRLARAYDGQELVGFAYGYTGRHGQWWTDNVPLEPSVAEVWLGGHFELVTVGVLASARGAGVGRALMHALLDGLSHERRLLMTTDDPSDPARRLYASEGWEVIGHGIGDGTVVMGSVRRAR